MSSRPVPQTGDSFDGPLGSGGEMAVPGWRTARARYSDWPNRLGLRALGPLDDVELDPLVLPQFAEAARVDGRVMHEDVRAASVLGNEAESLVGVEPLDGTGGHESPSVDRPRTPRDP